MSEVTTSTATYIELMPSTTAADADFSVEFKGDKSRPFWALGITTSETFNGTTATLTLYVSVDGVNYIVATNADGTSIVETLAANSTIIINNEGLYKTGTFKVTYDKGNASAGTLSVRLNDGR